MNIRRFLCLAAGVLVVHSVRGQNFSGSDDFNDNSKDTTKWGTDTGFGTPAGVLNETNGRLEFSVSGTADTYEARPWIANYGSYTANWSVQLDTVIPSDSGPNGGAGFGLEIWSTSNTSLYAGIEHDDFGEAPEYSSYHGTTPDSPLDSVYSSNALTTGAVRISFDATTKVLSTFYDADGPANGYQWTLLASYGIAGSGGATASTNWGMSASDTFTVVPFGYSSETTVAAGQIYGDNFLATPEPSAMGCLLSGGLFFGCCFRWRRGGGVGGSSAKLHLRSF